MSDDIVINIKDVTMCFNLAQEQFSGLKDFLVMLSKRKLKFHKFYALSNINFNIKRGEAWALIGENGCGKSTLLKLISGIYTPTAGNISVRGSIAPLIELGAGFDLELTAKENIYLNGAMLGYGEKFMKEHFEEIINFAELSEFINVPIKNFSSGMVARLGFSIATMVKADILIIDEILAVGDIAFQQKCYKKMKQMMDNGTTVLFVSHDLGQVRKLCQHGVWLKRGVVQMIGKAEDVCTAYTNSLNLHI
jgi:lipopolysaccharide transport system ATP-binding protein